MIIVWVTAWWLAGASSLLWLQRGNNLTWGGLVSCIIAGVLGPIILVIVGFGILIQADFWSKPIFPERNK
jgi:hypothetical protein